MLEKWKSVFNFPDYSVSNIGRVRRDVVSKMKTSKPGRILKGSITPDGYMTVNLTCNGVKKRKRVHVLVAVAFCKDVWGAGSVCHKDGNPSNNIATNLYWGTQKQNVHDAIQHGRRGPGEKSGNVKLKQSDVLNIIQLYTNGMQSNDLADQFGVSIHAIRKIVNRKNWKSVVLKKSVEKQLKLQRDLNVKNSQF